MRTVRLRRILLPSDFSDGSARALRVALTLARPLKAELRAVHVVPRNATLRRATQGAAPLALHGLDAGYWLDELWRTLGAVREELPSSVSVLEGDVADRIVQEACAWRADLVVMGTRGATGRAGWGLGSVTEQVLLRAPCPVLSVPASAEAGTLGLQRLLVPVDFGEGAQLPLDYALTLAHAAGSQLLLLHVLDYFAGESSGSEERWGVPELQLDLAEAARQRLRRLLPPDAVSLGGHLELVVPGRPQHEIVRVAREQEADMLVLGFDARRVIGRSLTGSTLCHVMRGACCPVLAVSEA